MATTRQATGERLVDYPTSDGRPMAETDLHRQDMVDVIETLEDHFAADANVYVTGNLLLYYEEGNPRKHVAPDVFVVRGVSKEPPREYYLLWKEGRTPDLVMEITSKRTYREDQKKKWILYRDILKVPEYFQFDPREEYLKPSLQGHRLVADQYVPIAMVDGRLPSVVLGLSLERDGTKLRLYDPTTGRRLRTPRERAEEAELALRREAEARQREAEARQRAEAENERLRQRILELERQSAADA
jgi:Uma2 family endonuclease